VVVAVGLHPAQEVLVGEAMLALTPPPMQRRGPQILAAVVVDVLLV
jgi:hypothetical protein